MECQKTLPANDVVENFVDTKISSANEVKTVNGVQGNVDNVVQSKGDNTSLELNSVSKQNDYKSHVTDADKNGSELQVKLDQTGPELSEVSTDVRNPGLQQKAKENGSANLQTNEHSNINDNKNKDGIRSSAVTDNPVLNLCNTSGTSDLTTDYTATVTNVTISQSASSTQSLDLSSGSAKIMSEESNSDLSSEMKQTTGNIKEPSPCFNDNKDGEVNAISSQIGNSDQQTSLVQNYSSSEKYVPPSDTSHVDSSISVDKTCVSSQNTDSTESNSLPSENNLHKPNVSSGHSSISHVSSGHEQHSELLMSSKASTSHLKVNPISEGHTKSSGSRSSEGHGTERSSSGNVNIFEGSVPSSTAHNLPMPPQAHEKSTPHLIPIPSLPTNPMMSQAMSMPPGMNLFPPHLINPYFGGMMFDPRMAAAFQHPMFRGMPPLHPRFQQAPPQRQPRSRGPRGPRQSKAHQQHLHSEVLRHHVRPVLTEASQIKIDPLDNLTTSHNGSVHVTESSKASSRSSTPRSHTSLSSPVSTQPDNIPHSEFVSTGHPQSQQPPPAHSHTKLNMPPHSLGQPVLPTNESLPPPAHSSHPSLSMTKAVTTTQASVSTSVTSTIESVVSTSSATSTMSTVSTSHDSIIDSNRITTSVTTADVGSSGQQVKTEIHNKPSTLVQGDDTKISTPQDVNTTLPMQAHAHPNTSTVAITSGSVPMPAHVHPVVSAVSSPAVTQMPPTTTSTTSNLPTTTVSTPPVQDPSQPHTTTDGITSSSVTIPSQAHHGGSVSSSASGPMPMPAHFHPQAMGLPGMTGPPFMQQNVRVRGQRMSKQRGPAPDMPPVMPPGMMPPFGRFPPQLNHFMARMAGSPEMMALAQKMNASASTAVTSEGEQASVPQMPKFEGLTPNQMETFIRAMRMRPPHFAMRPGMGLPPRGMPPPPRYPGIPMTSPTGEGVGHRFPGMLQHPSATSGHTATTISVTSPTSSTRSVQMSPSQSPHPSASPVAPSASPMSSRTGEKTPSPVPRSPANSDTTSVGSTPIKQEPVEQRLNTCFQDEIDARTASQNALLKQLLANSLAMGGPRPSGTPFSEDSEDGSNLQLTPEQQKQLEMIESMPVIREVELTPEDWQSKTPEEREKLLELRKQAFEEKRREFEDIRKKRKPPAEPRKRKKKEKSADQIFPEMFVDGQVMMQQPQLQPPPKKRQRRPKQKKVDAEEDKDARVESFLQQLRMLGNVALQEPKVTSAIVNSPVHGSPSVLTGESQLKGDFGTAYLDGVADFYGSTLLSGLPPLGSLVGLPQSRDIESRRKFLADGQESIEQQRNKVPSDSVSGQRPAGTPPFSIGSLTGPAITAATPVLPSHPRIEPRVLALRGTDSPDTVISSSSPEHEFGEENPDFPMLKPINPPDEDRRCSPSLPLLQPIAVKAESLQVKEEDKAGMTADKLEDAKPVTDADVNSKKLKLDPTLSAMAEKDLNGKTNSFTSSLSHPLKDKDISVTLTLSAKAAEDIGGVLSSIAELLKIAVPPTYQVRSPSPDGLRMNLKHKEDPINIHNLIKMKPKFCRNCDMVVIDKGYFKKKSEMPFMIKEDHFTFREAEDEDIAFCSQKCYERFVMVYKSYFKSGGFQTKPLQAKDDTFFSDKSPSIASLSPFPSTPPTMISPRASGFLTPNSSGERTPQLTPTTPTGAPFLSAAMEPTTPTRQKLDLDKFPRKQKKEVPPKPPPKKWKNVRYRKWDPSFSHEVQPRPETPKSEVEVLWKALGTIITPDPMPEDKRVCVFCQGIGDGVTDGPGRLLNMDVDKWVHLNCALWSSEVYETLNGDLMNVDVAHGRSKTLECHICKKLGATLGCFKVNCSKVFHLGCAQRSGCMFFQDKTILCPPHAPKILPDNVLTNLAVHRKVYVNRDEDKQVASMIRGQEEGTYALRISSLILHSVGQLLPHQIATGKFHTRDFIYPVGFKSSRFYWSMRRLYKRCRYVCSISDNDGRPEFTIRVVEAGFEDIVMKDNSPRSVWFKVLEPLDKMRRNADLVKIFPSFMTGEELFGLTEPAIVRVIESLPGTDLLKNYAFKFGRCELIEMPLTINPSGCARTEPKLRTHFRKTHTLQSSHTSRSLPAMVTGVTGDINSPYMKQFVHSKSAQYRRLKTEWRQNVFLGRSRIQGLGLFAARDLEKHTMVIEYIGYLIRDEVANRMEITYDEQNRGVYMFRIDSNIVVDATMAGGPARYINHSCDPNCVAEVVPFDKESKIIIITNRRIPKGEELTYDYKFDFEDEQHKIPCCCGAKRCRKWMN